MHGLKISYRFKLKTKQFLYHLLGIATIIFILFLAYLSNMLIETIISMVLFFIYSPMFDKQYHSKTLFRCSSVSVVVWFIDMKMNLEIYLSIFSSVILTFLMTAISYYVRDFLDTKILAEEYKSKLEKFEHKCLDNLTEEEMLMCMPKIKHEVIHIVYKYLNRPTNQTATNFAMKNYISEATLFRYLKLVKETYEGLS